MLARDFLAAKKNLDRSAAVRGAALHEQGSDWASSRRSVPSAGATSCPLALGHRVTVLWPRRPVAGQRGHWWVIRRDRRAAARFPHRRVNRPERVLWPAAPQDVSSSSVGLWLPRVLCVCACFRAPSPLPPLPSLSWLGPRTVATCVSLFTGCAIICGDTLLSRGIRDRHCCCSLNVAACVNFTDEVSLVWF